MSDISSKFHEFALKSILFKGQYDWYFCYIKAEKIAHVLTVLSQTQGQELQLLAQEATELPESILYFAAGEIEASSVLALLLSLLTKVRLAVSKKAMTQGTGAILEGEYEALAERFGESLHPSPFLRSEDFAMPPLPMPTVAGDIKDTKGHVVLKTERRAAAPTKEPNDRGKQILEFVRSHKGVSIKDIAEVIGGCSEKTIQRELGTLIAQGAIKRIGERRWSQYLAA